MKFVHATHKRTAFVGFMLAGFLVACGGGGSSQRFPEVAVATSTPVVPPTATPVTFCNESPMALCVQNGNGPALNAAINNALPGTTIYVAPGSYGPVSITGRDRGPITVIGDELATVITNASPGAVTIDARGSTSALTVDGQTGFVFDSLTLRGSRDAAAVISNSSQITIQNSTITANGSDGIVLESADNLVVFDNLIYNNGGAGIRALSTFDVLIFNNTVYGHRHSGIVVGSSLQPAETTFIENNIVNTNSLFGIEVDPASIDTEEDYNLNSACPQPVPPALPCYEGLQPGDHDVLGSGLNPLFISPGSDFHLQIGINTSISAGLDAGDPFTPTQFVEVLQVRSTQTDLVRDTGTPDLGYHYPQSIVATVTAAPTRPVGGGGPPSTPTRTPTPTPTPTRTPTA